MKVQLVLTLALSILGWTYSRETPVEGSCPEQSHGNLRLVHKQGDNYGALQVCDTANGWKYMANDDWTIGAARLACIELGVPHLEPTTATLQLSRLVNTSKVESSICSATAQQLNNCIISGGTSIFVLTVNCSNGDLISREECSTECTAGSIRLVGGVAHSEGRVEVCSDGRWGTVCSTGLTEREAGHVCSRLGYTATNATIVSYRSGTGAIFNLVCRQPQPANATDCARTVLRPSQCGHSQDLGVRCQPYSVACEADCNERIASLTTAIPRECPTQPPTSPTEETASPPTGATDANEGCRDAFNKTLLGALLGLLGVILAAVLACWFITCVYFHRKTNRQMNALKVSPNDPDYEFNNPTYDTGLPLTHTSSSHEAASGNQQAENVYDVTNRSRSPSTAPAPGPEQEYSVLYNNDYTPGEDVRVVEGEHSQLGESDPQNYEMPTPTIDCSIQQQ